MVRSSSSHPEPPPLPPHPWPGVPGETAQEFAWAAPPPLPGERPTLSDWLGCGSPWSCRGQRHRVGRGHTAITPGSPPAHPKSPGRDAEWGVEKARQARHVTGTSMGLSSLPETPPASSRGRPCSRVAYARHMLFLSQHARRACKQPAGGGGGAWEPELTPPATPSGLHGSRSKGTSSPGREVGLRCSTTDN